MWSTRRLRRRSQRAAQTSASCEQRCARWVTTRPPTLAPGSRAGARASARARLSCATSRARHAGAAVRTSDQYRARDRRRRPLLINLHILCLTFVYCYPIFIFLPRIILSVSYCKLSSCKYLVIIYLSLCLPNPKIMSAYGYFFIHSKLLYSSVFYMQLQFEVCNWASRWRWFFL